MVWTLKGITATVRISGETADRTIPLKWPPCIIHEDTQADLINLIGEALIRIQEDEAEQQEDPLSGC